MVEVGIVSGDLDGHIRWDLAEQWCRAPSAPATTVVVDVSRVEHIDGRGLSTLLIARARLRARGHDLRLRAPSTAVSGLLRLTGTSGSLLDRVSGPRRPAAR